MEDRFEAIAFVYTRVGAFGTELIRSWDLGFQFKGRKKRKIGDAVYQDHANDRVCGRESVSSALYVSHKWTNELHTFRTQSV